MEKYKFKHKTKSRSKKAKLSIILGTLLTLIVTVIVVLVVVCITYKVSWDDVAFWLNPFSEGNNISWLLYTAVTLAILGIIKLIHDIRMQSILEGDE